MDSTYKLDGHERRILGELQRDGRISHAELARRIGLSPTAVADRVRDMESAGVIRGYAALVDANLVGLPIVAFVTMSCDGERCRRLASEIGGFPEVIECYRLTGDASALLKVAVGSIAELEHLVDRLSSYGKPSTAIILSTPLSRRPLPIEPRDADATSAALSNQRCFDAGTIGRKRARKAQAQA